MKKTLFLLIGLLLGATAFSQNNPYAIFGHETKVQYETTTRDLFTILNKDTASDVKKLIFHFENEQILLVGIDDTILDVVKIQPHLTLRFISPDPKEKDYPSLSPYNFVANMPIRAVDPDGRDIYILFYAEGDGSSMFRSAAETRQRNIEKGQFFDPAKDKVVILKVSDMADIQNQVANVVSSYSEQYGKTREFGVWSHAAWQGPIGSEPASSNSTGYNQMSLEGWGQIDFNWTETGASATFYGCNTGNDLDYSGTSWVGSFARNVSQERNFRGVQVAGQSTSSYPSNNPFTRVTSLSRSAGIFIGDTYMVGGNLGEGSDALWFNPADAPAANPLNVFKDGKKTGSGFQSPTSGNPIIGQ